MVGKHHQLNGHEFEQTLADSEGQRKPGVLQSMGLQRVGHDLATEQVQKKNNSDSRAAGTSVESQPIVSSPYPQVPHPQIQPTSKRFCVRLVESWDAEPADMGEPAVSTSQTCKKSDLYLYSNPAITPITVSPKWPGLNN